MSQTLVSMVLNGRADGIAKKSYDNIWNYALANGYSPRGMKMDAVMSNSLQIGIATVGYILRAPLRLANKSNFFSHVHQGLHDYLTDNGAKTVFLGSEDLITPKDLEQFAKTRMHMRGLVIMGEVDASLARKLAAIFGRVVYASARLPGVCHSVVANDEDATEKLVEHLHNLGHRRYAWLGGSPGTMRHRIRLDTLKAALQRRGVVLEHIEDDLTGGADRREGYDCAMSLLKRSRSSPSTAWVCFNGLMARGAITCLLKNGYEVGNEISVAALDYTRVREMEWPTLTSSGAIPEELGRIAAELIINDSESSYFKDIVIPATLYAGESTGPTSVKSKTVKASKVTSEATD
ncbi:LacI family DNA-binding transcriptional regulator [Cerasicoccus arenae]|uniref:LacI family DNA-binding transcriptional regulator n=1 Tax=Cerasicoccus arenae TaxID=424488 RepID=UPI00167B1FD6|nr:LacI family DNA-binding transcriptional regulator [Cerasicoccus arenae]MBK1857958.1 LacI family DNA-binding transcriptional regulator [Cerasicoccus arenae]